MRHVVASRTRRFAAITSNTSARAVTVLEDDSIVATGYLTSNLLSGGGASTVQDQQPVIYKVKANGDFDASFATEDVWDADGVWHDYAVGDSRRAEAYGAALQSDGKLVTIGYGTSPVATNVGTDWVSFRYTADGNLDATYGDNGAAYIDAGHYGDNGRFVLALPDDRILAVGVGRPNATPPAGQEQPEADAMVAILTADGHPDTSFAEGGFKLFDMGGTADHFWAAAVSPDKAYVTVVGIAGAETAGVNDDDSVLLFIPIH